MVHQPLAERGTGSPTSATAPDPGIDLAEIRRRCHGMLSFAVYRRLYALATELGPGNVVEIGTAHGAATVVLALGMRAAGHAGTLYSFDQLQGGSRAKYGGYDDNLGIVKANLAHFGVDDIVRFHGVAATEAPRIVPEDSPIAMLILDADGRIDRDLLNFYNRLAPGAPVVIDDHVDRVRVQEVGPRSYRVDAKMRLTFLLVRAFVEQGIVQPCEQIDGTLLCRQHGPLPAQLDPAAILAAYRQLVFTDGEPMHGRRSRLGKRIHRSLKRLLPTQ